MDSHDLMSCLHDEYDFIDVVGDWCLNIDKSMDNGDDGVGGCGWEDLLSFIFVFVNIIDYLMDVEAVLFAEDSVERTAFYWRVFWKFFSFGCLKQPCKMQNRAVWTLSCYRKT